MSQANPFFLNPVLEVPEGDRLRTSIVLDKNLVARIMQVNPKQGIIQTTINILLTKLCNELDRTNLTDYAPFRYERAVVESTIGLGVGITAPVPSPGSLTTVPTEADNRDERPGAVGVVGVPSGHDAAPNSGVPLAKRGRKAGDKTKGSTAGY